MKSIIAAKMSAMRKRSVLTSSAASSVEAAGARDGTIGGSVPKEPSSHHGKMQMDPSEEVIDIVLHVAVDSIHAVTDIDNSIVFEADFGMLKEIIWDHTEWSVCFVTVSGMRSPLFIFASALVEVESQLKSSLQLSGQQQLPDQVYVGVLVGRNLPSSPILQRRASSIGTGVQPSRSLPAALKRELLAHERPSRTITPREQLALQYFKSGILSFPCSINGDMRGLKLDGSFLYVFPTPDCHDRSACLFSYQYEQVDSCEVRGGVRLELRFRRSGAKQPTFIAFQSSDAPYIRDAIWYFKYGVSMDEYFRSMATSTGNDVASAPGCISSATTSRSPRALSNRRGSLKSFQDEELSNRIQSRCAVIGCNRRSTDDADGTLIDCVSKNIEACHQLWMCEEHTPTKNEPGSPQRSPSKRSGLLSRAKSIASMSLLIHTKHYMQTVKYHGTLLKSGGKYQMTKAWNQKIAALIDTPLGGFLCYYDKLAHCPGLSEAAPKERRAIDLSSVICIRRESSVLKASHPLPFAFDIVTVYRTWTFAASDMQEYEVWLSLLGEAIEKQTSAAPDKPLRFPVKCLRDPLHNLPSRNDGSTALEVSSNGVTICSGTEGESEVYNWYFTEIQKWSVAKQHDNTTCCFISCAVDSVGTVCSQGAVASRYQDFLFQAPEADAICSTIEFFVGRCMAKLETLGPMQLHAQSRQSSRRPSLESAPSKPAAAQSGDEKKAEIVSTKEVILDSVPLCPVGSVVPTSSLSDQPPPSDPLSTALEPMSTPTSSLAANNDTSVVHQVSAICCIPTREETSAEDVSNDVPSIRTYEAADDVELSSPTCLVLEEDQPITTDRDEDAVVGMKYRLAPPPPIETRTADLAQSELDDLRISDRSACDAEADMQSSLEHTAPTSVSPVSEQGISTESPMSPHDSERSGTEVQIGGADINWETSSGVVQEDIGEPTMTDSTMETPDDTMLEPSIDEPLHILMPCASKDCLMDDMPMVGLWPGGYSNDNDSGQREVDNDRFQSFEYCECTVGVLDSTAPTASVNEVDTIAENDDEEFEDARCDAVDTTELSTIVMDGGSGENDEDSLIVLEDEECSSLHVDMVSEYRPMYETVDEINPSYAEESCDLDQDADDSTTTAKDITVTEEFVDAEDAPAVKISIPTFTTRKWATLVDATEYDETLPRITVYSVRFSRGRLQRAAN